MTVTGLEVVLSEVQSGRERIIAYAAHALSKAERNYSTTRKELLALEWTTEQFETSLYGQYFLARTVRSALQWLRNFKNPRGQVTRWLARLSYFDFVVEHCPGSLHGDADGLSCLSWDEDASVKDQRDATLIQSVNMEPLSKDSLRMTQNQDSILLQVETWLIWCQAPRGDVDGGGVQTTIVLITVGKAVFEGQFAQTLVT